MCWIGENIPKIAKTNVKAFKVVYVDDEKILRSVYHPLFTWDLYNEYTTDLSIRKCFNKDHKRVLEINKGFHCYNPDKVYVVPDVNTGYIDSARKHLDCFALFCKTTKYRLAVLECVIPAGTTYYENENGEIVTSTLKPKTYSIVK